MSTTTETSVNALEAAHRATQVATEDLDKARDAEARIAERTRALRGALAADRERLATLEQAAFAGWVEGAKTADTKRRELEDVQNRSSFLMRTIEWLRVYGESDARAVVLRAEIAVSEAMERTAEAEYNDHEARLLALLREAATLNGELEISDGGKSEVLKRAIHAARRATAEAREALRTFEREARDSRENFERENRHG